MRVYHDFFWYPDPDQRFLMRIRIRPNDTDPTGSGSETLPKIYVYIHLFISYYKKLFLVRKINSYDYIITVIEQGLKVRKIHNIDL